MENNLNYQISLLMGTRRNIQKLMDGFSLDKMNLVPQGFNNNLIWNYGHVLVTQQLLVYGLSGLELICEKDWVGKYRKGTKPEVPVAQDEYEAIKNLFFELPAKTLTDHENGLFAHFNQYETSYGITLSNALEAVQFNNLHEAMHLGMMKAIAKFIS